MLERREREGGAVGAKGRAGGRLAIARALTGLGGEAVAGGSGGGGEERGERSICEQQYMMVGGRPFLRVSSRPVLYAGRDSWKSSARRSEAPRESAYRLQAPSALTEPSQIVRCGLEPARVSNASISIPT